MPRSYLIAIGVTLAVLIITFTLVFQRYFFTAAVQQRLVEQQARPVATPLPEGRSGVRMVCTQLRIGIGGLIRLLETQILRVYPAQERRTSGRSGTHSQP